MPAMPADEAARLSPPRMNLKRPLTKATVRPTKAKAKRKSAGMKVFDKDHSSAESAAGMETAKENPWLACMAGFVRDHPDAELPAEQQRLEDWTDAKPPPANKPATARRGLQELDANSLNASPKDQNFVNDALRRIYGTAAKAEADSPFSPTTASRSARPPPPSVSFSTSSYALNTLAWSPSGNPTTTINSPTPPSARPNFTPNTSASRHEALFGLWDEENRVTREVPKCPCSHRLTSEGKCVTCRNAASRLRLQKGMLSITSPKCGDFPKCGQVAEGSKCYYCAYLALAAKRDVDGGGKLREKGGRSNRVEREARRVIGQERREARAREIREEGERTRARVWDRGLRGFVR